MSTGTAAADLSLAPKLPDLDRRDLGVLRKGDAVLVCSLSEKEEDEEGRHYRRSRLE
jgi:hypothetical protein